ncbi:MAG: hypothetical protein Q9166_005315 [cf. Caloplaca sp. 2 TL-2023]
MANETRRICVMNAARIGITATADQADYTYTLINVAIFSGLEIWFGIIAACAPTLRPLFARPQQSTYKRPFSGYRDHTCRRSHSDTLYSKGDDESRELEDTSHGKPRDELNGADIQRFDDDRVPLKDTLSFPEKVSRPETAVNPWSKPPRFLRKDSIDRDTENIRVMTDISVTSLPAARH